MPQKDYCKQLNHLIDNEKAIDDEDLYATAELR